jgi:hypothetical protein
MDSPQSAACCGILGGGHIEFIRYYADSAICCAQNERNGLGWSSLGESRDDGMLLEQYHLAAYVGSRRHRPGSLFCDVELMHLFCLYRGVQSEYCGQTGLHAPARQRLAGQARQRNLNKVS